MKKLFKMASLALALVATVVFVVNTNAQNSQVTLDITAGTNTYNVSGTIDLGDFAASFTAYDKVTDNVNGDFEENSFLVRALSGDALSLKIDSDNLVAGSHQIDSGNVYIKYASALVKSWDTSCAVTSALTTSYVTLWAAQVTLFTKTDDGKVCEAAIQPNIGVDINANQPVGSYAATLNIYATNVTYDGALTY